MKISLLLPSIVLGAASLAFSAGAIAGNPNTDTLRTVDPWTGLVNGTGAVVSGVGGAAVGVFNGVGTNTHMWMRGATQPVVYHCDKYYK